MRIPKSVSLKELLTIKEEKAIEDNLPKDPFDQRQLIEAWMAFAYTVQSSDLDFFSTLSAFQPQLKEGGVVVEVHNVTQQGDIQKLKPKLLASVRRALNNFDFDFEIVVNQTEAKFIAVTPQDKYKKLVEKNQLLEDLRKKLDLGF